MNIIKKRVLAIFTAVFMIFGSVASYGAEGKAVLSKSVRLTSYKGSISVAKGEKALSKITTDMRLFDGYVVKTSAESYAFLELDDSKFVKIDQNSSIKIQKKGKSNTLLIESGGLFFNVAKPLTEDESLQVRTSNVTMGIRGTTGAVSSKAVLDSNGNIKKTLVDTQIYTGLGHLTLTDNQTGKKNAMGIEPGNHVKVTADAASSESKIEKAILAPDGYDIPAVAHGELLKLPLVLKQMEATTSLDISLLIKNYESKQAMENQQAKQEIELAKALATNKPKTPFVPVPYLQNQPLINKEYGGGDLKPAIEPEKPKTDVPKTYKENDNDSSDDSPPKPKPTPEPIKPDKPVDPEIPSQTYVASVGGVKYKSFEAALEAATAGSQDILLLSNVNIEAKTTIVAGITLTIPDDIKLTVSDELVIDGKLVIKDGGMLTGNNVGTSLSFGTAGAVSLRNASDTELKLESDESVDSKTDVTGKTFYYIGRYGSKYNWQSWNNLEEYADFPDIAADKGMQIPHGKTTTIPANTISTNAGTVIIFGTLLGANASSDSYLYCAKDSILKVFSDSNIYDKDGNKVSSNNNKEFLAKWNSNENAWRQCSGAKIDDTVYASLDQALTAAGSDNATIQLIGDTVIENTLHRLSNDIILSKNITLEINSPSATVHILNSGSLTNLGTIIMTDSSTSNELGESSKSTGIAVDSTGSFTNKGGTIKLNEYSRLNVINGGIVSNEAIDSNATQGNIEVNDNASLNIYTGSCLNLSSYGNIAFADNSSLNVKNGGLVNIVNGDGGIITMAETCNMTIEDGGEVLIGNNVNNIFTINGNVKGINRIMPSGKNSRIAFNEDVNIMDESYILFFKSPLEEITDKNDIKGALFTGLNTGQNQEKWIKSEG